jgi:hypothetical protein
MLRDWYQRLIVRLTAGSENSRGGRYLTHPQYIVQAYGRHAHQ